MIQRVCKKCKIITTQYAPNLDTVSICSSCGSVNVNPDILKESKNDKDNKGRQNYQACEN